MSNKKNSRRNFLQLGAFGAAALITSPSWMKATAGETIAKKADQNSIKLGIAGYSFVNFNLDQSLAMMKRMDVKYLCIKDFHLPFNSTAEEIAAFHKKLADSNVTGYAVGPIYMKTKEEIDKAFDYCKRVGVNLMIGIPEIKDLPYVAQKAKENNVKFGIHNHGPEDKIYPNATVIWNHIKDLDKNLGMCFDMGHNVRDGQDSIKDLVRYKDRIFDIHLKNVTAADAKGSTCELGRGIIDIPAFTRALLKIKYPGCCSIEFEKDMKDPLAGIAESVGYFRGVLSAV
ncbi:sugar phosphate isomerase/epimerase family protein [Sphingobacterium endophyticum]|uniref:sugar phosphate isomerase/epimerase family protein n=1 Tax=Sphingobacterium endophyticum TaxID=2546448 RepID=UPI0012E16630|nr:sugar phosphate isomerase/epimerase [Sphingobacterium endophyticum]